MLRLWVARGLFAAMVSAAVGLTLMGPESHADLVEAMPHGIRQSYLRSLLSVRDESCWHCHIRLIGALEAIYNDLVIRGNSYNFDYALLVPFVEVDSQFDEPIPGFACHTILLSQSDGAYLAMIAAYRNSPNTLVGCAWAELEYVREEHPTLYPAVKAKMWRALDRAGAANITDSAGHRVRSEFNCHPVLGCGYREP